MRLELQLANALPSLQRKTLTEIKRNERHPIKAKWLRENIYAAVIAPSESPRRTRCRRCWPKGMIMRKPQKETPKIHQQKQWKNKILKGR